ncbi:MAG: DUF2085 domain-containing protein [Rudaea sp.]
MDLIIALAHWFGSAVCHQWPSHSYFVAGVELPLCARCTGLYLGGLLTLAYLGLRHPRAVGLPRLWMLAAMVLFFLAWAGDGVNSFLASFPTPLPHLYPPQNILRATTGMLMGITLGSLVFIMFNSLLWRNVRPEAVFASPREFLGLVALGAALVLVVNSQLPNLLVPLTLASLVAILTLNSALMAAMAASLMRRLADNWRGARAPLLAGIAVALFYLDAIALLRVLIGVYTGVPI